MALALVHASLQPAEPRAGACIITCTYPRRWCRHYYNQLAPALVQVYLQAPSPGVGADLIAGTQPWRRCRLYCRHPAPALVQVFLQAPGPGIGAGIIAGTRPCNHDGDNACIHTFHSYLPFMQPKWLCRMHACYRQDLAGIYACHNVTTMRAHLNSCNHFSTADFCRMTGAAVTCDVFTSARSITFLR